LLVGGTLLAFALPGMIKELTDMAQRIPHYADEAQDMAQRLQNLDMPMRLGDIINENISRVNEYVYKALHSFAGSLYSILGKVLAIIFSPILAFYILVDWERIRDNFLKLFSPQGRREAVELLSSVDEVLIEFLQRLFAGSQFCRPDGGFGCLFAGSEISSYIRNYIRGDQSDPLFWSLSGSHPRGSRGFNRFLAAGPLYGPGYICYPAGGKRLDHSAGYRQQIGFAPAGNSIRPAVRRQAAGYLGHAVCSTPGRCPEGIYKLVLPEISQVMGWVQLTHPCR